MRTLLTIGLSITFIYSYSQSYQLENPDAAVRTTFTNIDLINVNYGFEEDTTDVEIGQTIGKIAPYPDPLSEKFEKQIFESRKYYNNGDYEKASKILEKPYEREPDNKFIMEAYSRALYQIETKRGLSYKIYKKLVTQLDDESGMNDSTLTIDFWFREAYWKLGTLYMDNGEWINAFEDISRFILSIQDSKGTPIYDYALTYLTECAFEMGHEELCEHFANRTLSYNPNNEQVKYYLNEIKK